MSRKDRNSIILCYNDGKDEMLRITPKGFYIRGVKVEQGPEEAKAVYTAFKQFLMWETLKR